MKKKATIFISIILAITICTGIYLNIRKNEYAKIRLNDLNISSEFSDFKQLYDDISWPSDGTDYIKYSFKDSIENEIDKSLNNKIISENGGSVYLSFKNVSQKELTVELNKKRALYNDDLKSIGKDSLFNGNNKLYYFGRDMGKDGKGPEGPDYIVLAYDKDKKELDVLRHMN